ncbi:Rne/Rng family ribonuclease [Paenibacillus psychroresistens]|uniref:Rne/Rng family ribonuclease n=2 Tax=Paenibacillus psychroresistens TaxID=1778678 RepID=A0A6B8RHK8_9BACL|nr:Rne/Rng family ribonuclease [Paenibacillus psychroresistens]
MMIVRDELQKKQLALLEDGKLIEFYMERPMERERAGNIYKGRVVNVLPGMEAAFVDIGLEKNAFLLVDDLLPAHLEKRPIVKPAITELLQVGQSILVQVKKEQSGSKGARITTHFTIPGRWVVLLPNADYVAVSKKIENEVERGRLKQIGEQLRLPGEGVILRTVADGVSAELLELDIRQLRVIWDETMQKQRESNAHHELLYRDLAMIPRLIRDLFTEEVSEIVVDQQQMAEEIKWLLHQISPSYTDRVILYTEEASIFTKYPVSRELERALERKITLPSGGNLILDQTEALLVIDVNTGKFVGDQDLERTVLTINLEAAEEISRLLRLRNLSGIIIVDFIDMTKDENRRLVVEKLEACCAEDRTKTIIVGWTKLGLMEITRKKVRDSLTLYE